ncbi:MAG: transglutaminase-like domain-containing protein [Candidatus Bathyarchaeia archaeon]
MTNVPEQQPTAFQAFTSHYVGVMGNLNSSETRTKMAAVLDPGYNQTDLFSWEASRLEFVQDPSGWREDPVDILSSGKGICTQWSIVYVSACLSLGYPSRLTVAVDTASWNFIHMWAEDYFNGSWLHVDPSDKVWNDPSRYQGWDWGKGIGGNVKIYTFEDGKYEEVTSNYGLRSG